MFFLNLVKMDIYIYIYIEREREAKKTTNNTRMKRQVILKVGKAKHTHKYTHIGRAALYIYN